MRCVPHGLLQSLEQGVYVQVAWIMSASCDQSISMNGCTGTKAIEFVHPIGGMNANHAIWPHYSNFGGKSALQYCVKLHWFQGSRCAEESFWQHGDSFSKSPTILRMKRSWSGKDREDSPCLRHVVFMRSRHTGLPSDAMCSFASRMVPPPTTIICMMDTSEG